MRFEAVVVLVSLMLALYWLVARPYQLRLGATDAEVRRAMPGDDLSPNAGFLATRAITIRGTPEAVWPWLVQMGFGRAGYYGYDILENIGSPRGIRSADRIVPELQHYSVGDSVPISSVATMQFSAIEPNRYLIWAGRTGGTNGAFTWALYPVDASHTRLVSRIRWSHHWSQPGILALDLFSEFTDHIAVRKILAGVRDRVEGHVEPMFVQNTEFAVYVIAALLLCITCVLLLVRAPTWRLCMVGLSAGTTWLITWYAPVPLWIGIVLELLVLVQILTAVAKARQERTVMRSALTISS